MNLIKFDAKHSGVTINNDMLAAAKQANALLHTGEGAGNDFLGWVNLPSSISDEHLREVKAVAEKWSAIVNSASGPLKIYLQTAKPSVDESGTRLMLVYRDEFDKSAMESGGHIEILQGLIGKQTGKQVEIVVELAKKGRGNIAAYPDLSELSGKVSIEYVD